MPRTGASATLLLVVAALAGGCRSRPWAAQERATRRMIKAYDEGGITPEQLANLHPEPILTYSRTYHTETGQLSLERRIEIHSDGRIVKHGPEKEWFADGTPKTQRSYQHGEPDGTWRTFHRDGTLESEVVMRTDAPETATWWYASGALEARGQTVRGVKHGPWTHFHANGNPAEQGDYEDGLRSGAWRFWWEDGTPRSVGEFERGRRTGQWTHWSRDGDPLGARGW